MEMSSLFLKHLERDRKLDAAKEQRKNRRQGAA
jgi:hypothetical protein